MLISQDVIPELLGMGGGGGGGRGGRGGMRGGFGGRGGAPGGGGAPAIQNLSPHQLKQLNGILRNAKFTVTHRYVPFCSCFLAPADE